MPWEKYNPNPFCKTVGDCAVRAVSKALDLTWDEAFALISANGFLMKDMPSSNSVFGSVLRQKGFRRYIVPNTCPDCYTAEDFAGDHPEGVYVLGFGGHVATIVDGTLYDSWDSSNEVPIYYWTRTQEDENTD